MRRRLGWKLYFGFVVLLFAVAVAVEGLSWMQPLDVLSYAAGVVSLVGLFGFTFSRAIGAPQFWRVWFVVGLIFDVLYESLFTELGLANQIPGVEPVQLIEWVFILPLIAPLYVALFLYGYRSEALWANRAAA